MFELKEMQYERDQQVVFFHSPAFRGCPVMF